MNSGSEPEQVPTEVADMAKQNVKDQVDLSESSIYGRQAEEEPQEETSKGSGEPLMLDPATAEEIDALKLDLTQEDERRSPRYGSGAVVDDLAEERLAELTETGPDLDGEGAESLVPGLDDTSQALRDKHPNTEFARADAVIEGNVEEPREEELEDPKVDEGTAG